MILRGLHLSLVVLDMTLLSRLVYGVLPCSHADLQGCGASSPNGRATEEKAKGQASQSVDEDAADMFLH